jgi:hypothetical protein
MTFYAKRSGKYKILGTTNHLNTIIDAQADDTLILVNADTKNADETHPSTSPIMIIQYLGE